MTADELEKEELLWIIGEELAGRKVYPLTTAEDHRERARQLRASGNPRLSERAAHYDRAAEAIERLPDADRVKQARLNMRSDSDNSPAST
jgi:hypothetical protein